MKLTLCYLISLLKKLPVEIFEAVEISVVADSDLVDAPVCLEAQSLGHLPPLVVLGHPGTSLLVVIKPKIFMLFRLLRNIY